jgi:hypothetical protein
MTDIERKRPESVRFHYIKSPHFLTVHVDGAIGGPTPRGLLHAAIYAERAAIPTSTVQPVLADGRLGDEIQAERVGKEGVVRELQVDLVMDLPAAQSLYKWLGEHVGKLEALLKKEEK